MKKFSCIAIDDEPLALLVITQFCERFGNLDLSTFSEPRIGLEEIKRHKPDLVFLDIEMNSINGTGYRSRSTQRVLLYIHHCTRSIRSQRIRPRCRRFPTQTVCLRKI